MRMGLATMIWQRDNMEIVAEVGTVADTIKQVAELKPDLVLLDVQMSDGCGFDACAAIRSQSENTRILVLSAYSDDRVVGSFLESGAEGFLLKGADHESLFRAINQVANGQSVLDAQLTRQIVKRAQNPVQNSVKSRLTELSMQESKVLAWVAEGLTNKEIGVAMNLSEKTVKNYLSNLMQKLGVSRRSQAAAMFVSGQQVETV